MSRTLLCAATCGAAVLAGNLAIGQVVGPARRAVAGAAAAAGAPGVGARIENREAARGVTPGNRWRYVNHANRWWYYTPQNSWMYYHNNAWAPYNAATYNGSAVPATPMVPAGYGAGNNPDSWRYVYNGNQWWYYTPQNTWMYYGSNQWMPYQAGAGGMRYATGYRGTNGVANNSPGAPPAVPMNPANTGQQQTGARDGESPAGHHENPPPSPPPGNEPNTRNSLPGNANPPRSPEAAPRPKDSPPAAPASQK
jgi:hypothetical protein